VFVLFLEDYFHPFYCFVQNRIQTNNYVAQYGSCFLYSTNKEARFVQGTEKHECVPHQTAVCCGEYSVFPAAYGHMLWACIPSIQKQDGILILQDFRG
jgi:hypothetical protein